MGENVPDDSGWEIFASEIIFEKEDDAMMFFLSFAYRLDY